MYARIDYNYNTYLITFSTRKSVVHVYRIRGVKSKVRRENVTVLYLFSTHRNVLNAAPEGQPYCEP